jgi:hypothetical protein
LTKFNKNSVVDQRIRGFDSLCGRKFGCWYYQHWKFGAIFMLNFFLSKTTRHKKLWRFSLFTTRNFWHFYFFAFFMIKSIKILCNRSLRLFLSRIYLYGFSLLWYELDCWWLIGRNLSHITLDREELNARAWNMQNSPAKRWKNLTWFGSFHLKFARYGKINMIFV